MESDAGGSAGEGRGVRRRGRGQGKGLVLGIAAVVLVGVGGRFLAGLGKLKGRSAGKDVVGEAIVIGDAAAKLGKSSEDLASAALGSALHRMNGEGKGLGREELGCRESDGELVGEGQMKGFVVNGTFREKDGVPSLCAEVKVLGVKRGVEVEEGGHGHVEGAENGVQVVGGGDEEVVAQVEDELVLPEAAVKNGLADLKIVTYVSYPDSLVEVTCTAVERDVGSAYESSSSGSDVEDEDEGGESTSMILPQEEEREQEDASSSVKPEDDEGSSTPIEPALLESVDKREVFVGDGSPSISSAETVKDSIETSVQTAHPLLLSPQEAASFAITNPSRLQSERSADRSSEVLDPDLISSHLLHSRATPPAATTHLLDLLQLPETAVAQPTTPARESEKVFSVKPASPLSDGESAVEKDAPPEKEAQSDDESSVEKDALPEKEAQSDGESAVEKDALPEKEAETKKLVMPAAGLKEALKAVNEARDIAQLLVNDAKQRGTLERVALEDSSNIDEEVRPGVLVFASKVLLDTHNSSVQSVKATIVAAPACDFEKHPSGEFWAYVGRGVPSVILLGFFFPRILAFVSSVPSLNMVHEKSFD